MKKTLMVCAAMFTLATMTACGGKDIGGNEYNELIVGHWDVTTYHLWVNDLYNGRSWPDGYSQDVTYNLPDTSYSGYDAVEFNADGTMRWHMNDRMVSEGGYSDPYVNGNWTVRLDSLITNDTRYGIKQLDSETLVIEDYYKVSSYQNHHGWERINHYTFRRGQ